MNIFDSLAGRVHATITKIFGYDATWTASGTNTTHIARVGYKDPSEKEYLAGLEDFEPDTPYMDYYVTSFPGLKASVDAGNPEYINIAGKGSFVVLKVLTKSDGDTYIAKMQAVTP